MTNKSPKALPGVPASFSDLEQVRMYLEDLTRALTEQHQRSVEGPLNKVPFTVTNYDDKRDIDAMTISQSDLSDLVATLLIVLQKGGVLR